MKKGQMEILGLGVVIAIVLLGMLFVVKFTIDNDPGTLKASFKNKEIIANFLNAMRVTTVEECNGATVEQLLIDCADGTLTIDCDNLERCTPINPTKTYQSDNLQGYIQKLFLNHTLDKWKIAYTLEFRNPGGGGSMMTLYHTDHPEHLHHDLPDDYQCLDSNVPRTYSKMERDLKPVPLATGGTMFVDIKLCY